MEKIALPTRNGAVDDHFGHCECYTIFTLDADRRIAGRQTLPAAEGCGCKSDIAQMGIRDSRLVDVHHRLPHLGAFGRDDDDAVGAAHAEDSQRRGCV